MEYTKTSMWVTLVGMRHWDVKRDVDFKMSIMRLPKGERVAAMMNATVIEKILLARGDALISRSNGVMEIESIRFENKRDGDFIFAHYKGFSYQITPQVSDEFYGAFSIGTVQLFRR